MTPRVAAPSRPALPSFRRHRPPPLENLPTEFEQRAFWSFVTAPSGFPNPADWLPEEEYRVLSKAASGGGFLVPTDVEEKVTAAARAVSAVAQVATDITTTTGATLGMALGSTHTPAAWIAESGSYTATDETITQQNLGAHKGGTKILVSEELMRDEAVDLDNYLTAELGARLGALQETAFCTGDGSGKPLGLVHASSPYTVVTAAAGSSLLYKLADLMAVFKALPSGYRPQASWLIAADDFASLAGTADTAGGLVFPGLQFGPALALWPPCLHCRASGPGRLSQASCVRGYEAGLWHPQSKPRCGFSENRRTPQRLRAGRTEGVRPRRRPSSTQRCSQDLGALGDVMAGNFSGPTIDQLRNADPSQTFVERRGGGFIVSWPEGSPEFRSTFRALPRGPRTAAEYQRRLEAIEAETDAISWS